MFLFSKAQRTADIGIFLGNGFYMGDVNHNQLFYALRANLGGMYRINFSPRYSLRASISYAELSGKDTDFDFDYQQIRQHRFYTELIDYTLQVEFNFLPYSSYVKQRSYDFTPYIAIGFSFLDVSNENNFEKKDFNTFALPFAIGFKYTVTHKLRIGIEWNFRKTFSDEIDALTDTSFVEENYLGKQRNYKNNKDWTSAFGFFATYKLFYPKMKCPVYNNKKFLFNFRKKNKSKDKKKKKSFFKKLFKKK